MARGKKEILNVQNMFVIIMLALVGLYVFSQFFTYTPDEEEQALVQYRKRGLDIRNLDDINIDQMSLTIFKLLILGGATMGGYLIFNKLSDGRTSKRDAFTIVLMALIVYFLWNYFLVDVWQAETLNELGRQAMMKMGIV